MLLLTTSVIYFTMESLLPLPAIANLLSHIHAALELKVRHLFRLLPSCSLTSISLLSRYTGYFPSQSTYGSNSSSWELFLLVLLLVSPPPSFN